MTVFITPPVTLAEDAWGALVSNKHTTVTYQELCAMAGVIPRVSGPALERNILVSSDGKNARLTRHDDRLFVSLPHTFRRDKKSALRVLEVLAYGFNDYAAREAVCGRGLFIPVAPRGRPRTGKALTPAEKMRQYRARKAAAK